MAYKTDRSQGLILRQFELFHEQARLVFDQKPKHHYRSFKMGLTFTSYQMFVAMIACFCIMAADVRASALPYDIDGAGYNSDELGLYVPMVDGMTVKRGMCRAGFTYNAILRNCMPSLGVLRGRGRAGRGRRGLSKWMF